VTVPSRGPQTPLPQRCNPASAAGPVPEATRADTVHAFPSHGEALVALLRELAGLSS